MSKIKCLLWDFGDTLCDERFIWGSGPEWMEVYETFANDGLGASWNLGHIGTPEFAEALSPRMGLSAEAIIEHMHTRCEHIQFFDSTYSFFKAKHLPQAIVTVNPDLFSEIIVPLCNFAQDCDVVVTSWEEGTEDKRILNKLAIERLNLDCPNSEALLIDNMPHNIEAWAGIGGATYHHTGDQQFARDAANGAEGLAESGTSANSV